MIEFKKLINWNVVLDKKDVEIWDRFIGNFWLLEKILVFNDFFKWGFMNVEEQWVMMCVFVGFIVFDILQGVVGVIFFMLDVVILYEEVVLCNIVFMEVVYVKFYLNIFMMLFSMLEINWVFCWVEEFEIL